jgi:hypothetical protein
MLGAGEEYDRQKGEVLSTVISIVYDSSFHGFKRILSTPTVLYKYFQKKKIFLS